MSVDVVNSASTGLDLSTELFNVTNFIRVFLPDWCKP